MIVLCEIRLYLAVIFIQTSHRVWWAPSWECRHANKLVIIGPPHALLIHLGQDKMTDISRRHFQTFKENVWISIKISLKFVPKGPINNIPVMVQKMAWPCSGARPLSELILVIFPTHICVIWPQWVERQPATENRDGHGHRRWQGNGTVLSEKKTHTKAKYADTKI